MNAWSPGVAAAALCGALLIDQALGEPPAWAHPVVLTGRGAPAELIELADTVTEMTMVKHHYKAGVPAQRGIED